MSVTATDRTADTPSGLPPTPPPQILPIGVTGLVVAVAAGTLLALALLSLRDMLGTSGPVGTGILVALAIAAFVPVVPALRGLAKVGVRQARIAEGDLPAARREAAAGHENATTAMGYALAVVIAAALIWFATANDGKITHTFLQWSYIKDSWVGVTKAFWVNVRVSIGAEIGVLVFGLLLAVMRLLPGRSGRPLRWISTLYVDVFRAIPSIIVIYLVGFGLSLAKVPIVKDLPPIWLAILALMLTYSGYVAEVYRAGIESIHPSQWAASRSLGLSYGMTLRTVIIPQAVRRMIPPLLNDFIGLQKDTALIGVMGVTDAFMQSRFVASNVFNLSPVIIVAALFVIITIPQTRFVDRLIAREQSRRAGGS